MNKTIFLISSLLFLHFPTVAVETSSNQLSKASPKQPYCEIEREEENLSTQQMQTLANQITVKVTGDNNVGSGVILGKQGNYYLVLTNSHVVREVNKINLKTFDGTNHNAEIVPKTNFEKNDLALLKFQTTQSYCVPRIAEVIPNIDLKVMAAGYSAEKGEIVFRTGKVKEIPEQALKEGYQIGYTSDIDQGMSGGAIIRSDGTLIGVNGRSGYSILNTGYVYENGKKPTDAEIQKMRKVSWGIPISKFLAQVDEDVFTAYKLPVPTDSSPVIPQVEDEDAVFVRKIEQKAKQFTVRIDSSTGENGSGVIIAKEGNTYTVLTSAHVVCENDNRTPPCPVNIYKILAPNGKKYSVEKSRVIKVGVDLAVVKFNSSQDYQIATLANYNPSMGDFIFTAGFPKLKNTSPWQVTAGRILNKEMGLLLVKESDFSSLRIGSLNLKNIPSLTGGYGLVYTSATYGGMSGGPVLDSQGNVIGIHGRAEAEKAHGSNINNGKVHIGFSLGIPISTFSELLPQPDVKPQKLENTRPQLSEEQVESIEDALDYAEVSDERATAVQWLERGNQLWRLGQYDEADEAFDEVIKKPKSPLAYLAYYGKGLSYLVNEDDEEEESVKAFEQALKRKPDFLPARRWLIVAYINLKQYDKALSAADKAIELQPQNPNGYSWKSVALMHLKRYAEAEEVIAKAIKFNPSTFNYYFRASMHMAQKDWDSAKTDFDKAIELNPKSVIVLSIRGAFYISQQKWDLALDDINKAIKINPKFADAYTYRGLVYIRQQNWDLALADMNKAIEINDESEYEDFSYNNDAYAYRGLVYIGQQKWDLALTDIKKAIELNPNSADAYIARGIYYLGQKKWDLAKADFDKVIELNPNSAEAYQLRGRLYLEPQKWDLAKANFDKAIELNSNSADAYAYRGLVYIGQQKWDLALTDIKKAIELNPNSADAYAARGAYYLGQKKWDLAKADFDKAIELNPNYAKAYQLRGRLYLEQKKWDVAKANFDKAIELNLNSAYAYRGLVYIGQQKWDLALSDINKAIKINPNSADAYAARGLVYIRQQKWDLVLTDLNKAIELDLNSADAYLVRGVYYLTQQKWNLAKADADKAIGLNPNSAESYQFRGRLYLEQKKWDLAMADLNKAINFNPNSGDAYAYRGLIYMSQEKLDLAKADFDKAIDFNPNSAESYFGRGMIYIVMNEKQKAIQDLQKAAPLLKAKNDTELYEQVINILQKLQQSNQGIRNPKNSNETALKLDNSLTDVKIMKENLWGEGLVNGTKKLFYSPKIKTLLSQLP